MAGYTGSSSRDKIKQRAGAAVQKAIREGRLLKPGNYPCVDCGGAASQYDHRDYRKPLEVVPVCRSCNISRGPGLPKIDHETDLLATKRPRSYDGFRLLWGVEHTDGEGFDPLSAVCHINLDAVIATEKAKFDSSFNLSAENRRRVIERNVSTVFSYKNETGKNVFGNVIGIARAEFFKRHDPWYPA